MEEANPLPGSPVPLPHPCWWGGGCSAICGPQGSPSSSHEWMRCWTPGPAMDVVFTTWLVLVARSGCSNAEGNQQLWAMHQAWRHSCQSPSVTHHCYCTIGVAAHWLYLYWDDDGVGSIPKHGECYGLLWTLYETCYGVSDPRPNCKICCYVPVARLHLDLWCPSQAPEWLRSQLGKQHHQGVVWTNGYKEGQDLALPCSNQWTGGKSSPNADVHDREIG